MGAPILPGYVCRMCGAAQIQQPWDAADGYVCANCGATNRTPLLSTEDARRGLAGAVRAATASLGELARTITEGGT